MTKKHLLTTLLLISTLTLVIFAGYMITTNPLREKPTYTQPETQPNSQSSNPQIIEPNTLSNSENLEECLKHASESDARQEIINEWRKQCYVTY